MDRATKHSDKLGREIELDDFVVASYPMRNSIIIAQVIKLHPKMIKIQAIQGKQEYNRYGEDVIIIDGPEVTAYLLRS